MEYRQKISIGSDHARELIREYGTIEDLRDWDETFDYYITQTTDHEYLTQYGRDDPICEI